MTEEIKVEYNTEETKQKEMKDLSLPSVEKINLSITTSIKSDLLRILDFIAQLTEETDCKIQINTEKNGL